MKRYKVCSAEMLSFARCSIMCEYVILPDRKDPAEIIHHIVEFDLQVFQDVTGLHTQLHITAHIVFR